MRDKWETSGRQVGDKSRQVGHKWKTSEGQVEGQAVRNKWEARRRQVGDKWQTSGRQVKDKCGTSGRQVRDK